MHKKPQLNFILYPTKLLTFKGTFANQALSSSHGGSLEIKFTISLSRLWFIFYNYWTMQVSCPVLLALPAINRRLISHIPVLLVVLSILVLPILILFSVLDKVPGLRIRIKEIFRPFYKLLGILGKRPFAKETKIVEWKWPFLNWRWNSWNE